VRGRALKRGHDIAAQHASAHFGSPWFDFVYVANMASYAISSEFDFGDS
jgi:hypothetical protein